MAAAHYRLSNLTAIIDFNKISQSGRVAEIMGIEPLADKWRAFGWEVREIDGHDIGRGRRRPRRAALQLRQAELR